MLGTHAADIDGLQSADAAVVLDLDAGEITDGVGHREGAESLQLLALQGLGRNDLVGLAESGYHRGVKHQRVGRRSRQQQQEQQCQDHWARL